MKGKPLCFLLTALTLMLVGCDLAPSAAPEHEQTPADAALESASKQEHECSCRDIEGVVRSTADFDTFTAEGTIKGDLKGTISFTGDPGSVAPIAAETFPPVNPATLSFTGQLEITTRRAP